MSGAHGRSTKRRASSQSVVMLPEGWRPIRSEDAATVAALIDEDEVFAGFRSRLGSQDVLDIEPTTGRIRTEGLGLLTKAESLRRV
jgi:hypothetical protein